MADYRERYREGGRENYLKPFMEDVGKAAKAGVDLIRGKKKQEPDAGTQLMGNIYPRAKGGSVKPTKWIQGAIKKPGQLHKDLGVPQGEKIPKSKLEAAAKEGGKVGQRARLAMTLSHMHSRACGGPVTPMQRKSTKGSPEFTDKELMQGYRKL